jgi:hypothetical protein
MHISEHSHTDSLPSVHQQRQSEYNDAPTCTSCACSASACASRSAASACSAAIALASAAAALSAPSFAAAAAAASTACLLSVAAALSAARSLHTSVARQQCGSTPTDREMQRTTDDAHDAMWDQSTLAACSCFAHT